MKTHRIFSSFVAAAAFAAAAFAGDPTGTWNWTTHSPAGDLETTLKLENKEGQLSGNYSNQFGDAKIAHGAIKDDVVTFEVVRNLGGSDYVVKYQGKLEGDTINGTIEAPNPDGGEPRKLEWHAKRAASEKAAEAKPKA